MKKGHIDIIVKFYRPVAAGIEHNIEHTYSHLRESGWDVTVHTSKDTLTEKSVLSDSETIKGIKIVRYPFKSDNLGFFPKINWDRTDIVCLHNFNVFYFWILIYILWLKITGRKKFALVLTPHGGFNPEWSTFKPGARILKIIYHYVFGAAIINLAVDKIRAVSEWEKEQMIKTNVSADKIITISNGLDDEAYANLERLASVTIKAKTKQWGKYIFDLGRIYVIKNYETTIRAMTKVPSDVRLIIAGPIADKPYLDYLMTLVSDLGLKDRVEFIGTIWGVDKFYAIKHAQMMVHMALWESFCNIVHEGISQGLVCLVANNTALPYLVKNGVNGYWLPTKDWKSLADKINFVLRSQNSKEIRAIKKHNLEFGKATSWRMVAAKLDNLYSLIVQKYV